MIIHGDCLDKLKDTEDDSIDSLVTDVPAGINFMGKTWDSNKGGRSEWIQGMAEIFRECLRVLKPGSHGLVWAIPRTSHWTASALEDAGFEIRDIVTHLFGSGFPKSHNLGNGWGTALKPASEHWVLIRKPLSEKTIAKNVLKHGTGGINIDESRIGTNAGWEYPNGAGGNTFHGVDRHKNPVKSTQGRFPSNLILSHHEKCVRVGSKEVKGDKRGFKHSGGHQNEGNWVGGKVAYTRGEGVNNGNDNPKGKEIVEDWQCHESCAVKALDEQSGVLKNGGKVAGKNYSKNGMFAMGENNTATKDYAGDSGGASRFFMTFKYCAKASKSDRGIDNTHPTVKSTKLMEYLIKLITPPRGTVLDPFMGSGSTGVAAKRCGFEFIGIELELESYKIAEQRILK